MGMYADLIPINIGNIIQRLYSWSNHFIHFKVWQFTYAFWLADNELTIIETRTIQISSPLLYAFIYWPNHGEHTTKCLERKCESQIPKWFMEQHMGTPSGCYLWWYLLQFSHGHQRMFVMLWGSPLWIYEEMRLKSRMFITDWPLNGNLKVEWCNVYHHFQKHGTKSSARRTCDWKNHRCMLVRWQRNSQSVGLGCPKVHMVGHSSYF